MKRVVGYGSWVAYALGISPDNFLRETDTKRVKSVARELFNIFNGKKITFVKIPGIKRYFNPEIARSPLVVKEIGSKEVGILVELSDEEFTKLKEYEGGIETLEEIEVEEVESGDIQLVWIFIPLISDDLEAEINYELIEYKDWLEVENEERGELNIDYINWLINKFPEIKPNLPSTLIDLYSKDSTSSNHAEVA